MSVKPSLAYAPPAPWLKAEVKTRRGRVSALATADQSNQVCREKAHKTNCKENSNATGARASPNGCTAYPMELEHDLSHKNEFQMESFGQEAAGTPLNYSQNERANRAQSHK